MALNTTANWLDYMQIKATEMEGRRLDIPRWVNNFTNQVTAAELTSQIASSSLLHSQKTQESCKNSLRPSRETSAVSQSHLDGPEKALSGFPLRLKVLKE